MPPRRESEPKRPVKLRVDGDEVLAEEGEPIAVALVAAGRLLLGRSIKYHRPRGPVCFSGRCDGCLMRVDGVANVMTCQVAARDGSVIETQNVIGTAKADLLSAADWFFPGGMNHHEMFTQFRPLNQVMQKVARRVAGIGKLPTEIREMPSVRRVSVDVLVIGAGAAGLSAAAGLAGAGLRVLVVEEAEEPGGQLTRYPSKVERGVGLPPIDAKELARLLALNARDAGAEILCGHSAVGVYEGEVAVDSEAGLTIVSPRRVIVATGVHEASIPIEGADLPGIFTVRGAATLLARGVLPGSRIVMIGEGPWQSALAEQISSHGAEVVGPFLLKWVERFQGRSSVSSVGFHQDGKRYTEECDAVIVDAPISAAYELGAQAGVGTDYRAHRFVLVGDPLDGATRAPFARAVGACSGLDDLESSLAQGAASALALVKELEGAS